MLYLLDTDACIEVLRQREPVLGRVKGASPHDLAIASMSEAELRYGALRSSDPERGFARIDAFLSAPIDVLPFGREDAHRHAEIRHALRSQPIGERDLVIASIAAARGLTLVTGNTSEFGRVPELNTANWLER